MALLKKATVKSYDAAQHRAAVQIAGSLGVWLDGVPVATDVPAADVVAGRVCSVLFLDEGNPEDAVVLEVHGALPSGGGSGGHTTFVAHSDTPGSYSGQAGKYVRVNSTPNALEFFDLVNAANAWSALQTFGAGLQLAASQDVRDSGGTGRIRLATGSPHVTITGRSQFSDQLSIGEAPSGNRGLNVAPSFGTVTANVTGARVQPALTTLDANNLFYWALTGNPVVLLGSGRSGLTVEGLNFTAIVGGSGTASQLSSVHARAGAQVLTGTITTLRTVFAEGPFIAGGTPTIPTAVGVDIGNHGHSAVTTAIGLRIANQAGAGTNRLLQATGATNDNLRVDAGDPSDPGADRGRSQVLGQFNENGSLNLRRLEWKDHSTLGAGDRVLVAV